MKVRWLYLPFFIACVCVTAFAYIGCSGNVTTCKSSDDCKNNATDKVCDIAQSKCVANVNKEGGSQEQVTADTSNDAGPTDKNVTPDKIAPDKTTGDAGSESIVVDDKKQPDGTTNPDICPPGCKNAQCGGTTTTEKGELGDACKAPKTGEPNPCKDGLACIENGIESRGYCYKPCKADADCGAQDLKCLESGVENQKICGVQNKEGEVCNYTQQAFCAQGLICLVSDAENTAGTCILRCNADSECSGGKVCRAPSSSSTNKYCLEAVLSGPKCIGESCSTGATATNCKSGLTCHESSCAKTCTTATQDTDCDKTKNETCALISLSAPRICLPPPSIDQAGAECNTTTKRCNDTKGLQCVAVTEEKSVCMKTCDVSKGEDNNVDCGGPGFKCRQPQGLSFAICSKLAKMDERCDNAEVCGDKPSACIRLAETEAYCLKLCDTAKNKSKEDGTNPDCDSGKGTCIQLSGTIDVDGNKYNGACLPAREKKLAPGDACSTDGNLRAPDCKEGARCVGLSGLPKPVCFVDCDPCKSVSKDGTTWNHPACGGGKDSCTPLVYSDGRPAGGICIESGEPVLNDGEYCGSDFKKGCKEGLVCVRFSSASEAKSVCVKKCDPGKPAADQCASARCGRLTSGEGACFPAPGRRRKTAEECLGESGTDGFHDCLVEENGKKLVCSRPAFPGAKRACQVLCNPVNGIKDNSDCKGYSLNNHLCLPADTRNPTQGACLEMCTFTNRLRCETSPCQIGACSETNLGERGSCTTPEKETECTKQGGTCVERTCIASVCN